MPFFFYDPTIVLLIPAIILAVWAQIKVRSTFKKYEKVATSGSVSGAAVAKHILQRNGIFDVEVETVPGELSDHYDPRDKKLRLSENNYHGKSLSAVAVAAHEAGHAIQHNKQYAPLQLRHAILPVTSFSSGAAFPLFFIGFLFSVPILIDVGIILFSAVVLFHLVTLPVEFNASNRALQLLSSQGLLANQEISGARKVLNAAALTYVAAAAVSLIHLVRLLILRGEE